MVLEFGDARIERMTPPSAVLFDLDDTLAPPHTPITPSMTEKLDRLLGLRPVAIVSAAPFERIERDVLSKLSMHQTVGGIYVFSENGGQCRVKEPGGWRVMYSESLSPNERSELRTTVEQTLAHTRVLDGLPIYGERIINREAGVTLSTLGMGAPQDVRKTWDPDGEKRELLRMALAAKLPNWNVYIGGLTSIDISRKNVSKARAVEWLVNKLRHPPATMLYIGDALYEGGNDRVVIPTGIQTRQVSGADETEQIIDEILVACA